MVLDLRESLFSFDSPNHSTNEYRYSFQYGCRMRSLMLNRRRLCHSLFFWSISVSLLWSLIFLAQLMKWSVELIRSFRDIFGDASVVRYSQSCPHRNHDTSTPGNNAPSLKQASLDNPIQTSRRKNAWPSYSIVTWSKFPTGSRTIE